MHQCMTWLSNARSGRRHGISVSRIERLHESDGTLGRHTATTQVGHVGVHELPEPGNTLALQCNRLIRERLMRSVANGGHQRRANLLRW